MFITPCVFPDGPDSVPQAEPAAVDEILAQTPLFLPVEGETGKIGIPRLAFRIVETGRKGVDRKSVV